MRSNPFIDIEELVDRMSTELPMGMSRPPVDLLDEGDQYLLRVDLPGYERDELDITLRDRELTIAASRVEEEETVEVDDGRYIRRERDRHGTSRSVRLPEPVEAEAIDAVLSDGVLEVTLPKRHGGDGHRIEVQ